MLLVVQSPDNFLRLSPLVNVRRQLNAEKAETRRETVHLNGEYFR